MTRKTTTKSYAKSLARSGPELQPSQIRLADEAQTDKDKVFTQTDVNQGMGGGGGADLTGYAKTNYVDSADNALNALLATETQARKDGDSAASYQLQQAEKGLEAKIEANTQAIEQIEIPEGGGSDPSLPYELVLGETDSNELVKKRQSAEDGVAPAQVLETITLKDSKGANLGGIYFESSNGIGVALSNRYENTILIQGGYLENKITALEERVAELEAKPSSEGYARTATYRFNPKVNMKEPGGCQTGPCYITMNTFDVDGNLVDIQGYENVRFVFVDGNGNPADEFRKIVEITPHGADGEVWGYIRWEGDANDMDTWLHGFANPPTKNIITMILT